jgi:hypothetical protein
VRRCNCGHTIASIAVQNVVPVDVIRKALLRVSQRKTSGLAP